MNTKRLLAGILCIVLLISNTVCVYADELDSDTVAIVTESASESPDETDDNSCNDESVIEEKAPSIDQDVSAKHEADENYNDDDTGQAAAEAANAEERVNNNSNETAETQVAGTHSEKADYSTSDSRPEKDTSVKLDNIDEEKDRDNTAIVPQNPDSLSDNEVEETDEEDPLANGEATGYAENSTVISDAKADSFVAPASDPYSAMIALQTQYPDGRSWTNANTYTSRGKYFQNGVFKTHSGGGCHAFALILSDAAYGSLPLVEHRNFDDIHVGDILRLNNDTHSVMIMKIEGDWLTLAEGNYGERIHWGRRIRKSSTRSSWSYIITRKRVDIDQVEGETTTSVKYDGNAKTPRVYMGWLNEGDDYTVSYSNNVNPGTATAIVTGINNLCGTKRLNFTIEKGTQNLGISYSGSVREGETVQFRVTGAKSPVVYTSSNNGVAIVNNQGIITGVKEGTVTITATATENAYYKSAQRAISVRVTPGDKVKSFVRRLYRTILEREPDQGGLLYWTDELKSGRKTGAQVVEGFYLSDEMTKRRLSWEKAVELAYSGIMGRTPDSGGKAYWVDALNSGVSYRCVISGFAESQEFTDLCASYGIRRGSIHNPEPRDQNIGVTKYVSRLYTKTLGRGYDTGGLNYWCDRIINDPSRENVISIAADGFFHSDEFVGKNLNNDEYIRVCYRTFLGREAEKAGFDYWKQLLDSGEKSRDDLIRDFAYSDEFSGIMASYGL